MTMHRFNRLMLPLAFACLCLPLAGCVGGLLGGGKPAQLFRFGSTPATTTATAAPPAAGAPTPSAQIVTLMPVQFAAEIEGDRILASEGAKASYIKGARWTGPAPVLFEEALREAFRQRAPAIMLAERRDGLTTDHLLQINVERFEAAYPAPGATPTITVVARMSLIDVKTRLPVGSTYFQETQQAGANDIAAIVAAFDAAASRSTARVADWTRNALPVSTR